MDTFVSPDKLPEPWMLNEEWLERLEIPEELRRHYGHLSEVERRKLEGDRLLIKYYQERGLLPTGKTTHGLVSRMANDMDRHWLRAGKGRAVDFKKTFEVLEIYADYHAWASQFSGYDQRARHTLLDFILPYWAKDSAPTYHYYSPGFLRITCDVWNPMINQRGIVRWGYFLIEFTELQYTKTWKSDEIIDPFTRLYPEHRLRTFGSRDSCGFLAKLQRRFRIRFDDDQISGQPLFRKDQRLQYIMSIGLPEETVTWSEPNASQVKEILDMLAYLHFAERYPSDAWRLQFEVAPDLTKIVVASTFFETGPFDGQCGILWRDNDRLPPLVWPAPETKLKGREARHDI